MVCEHIIYNCHHITFNTPQLLLLLILLFILIPINLEDKQFNVRGHITDTHQTFDFFLKV